MRQPYSLEVMLRPVVVCSVCIELTLLQGVVGCWCRGWDGWRGQGRRPSQVCSRGQVQAGHVSHEESWKLLVRRFTSLAVARSLAAAAWALPADSVLAGCFVHLVFCLRRASGPAIGLLVYTLAWASPSSLLGGFILRSLLGVPSWGRVTKMLDLLLSLPFLWFRSFTLVCTYCKGRCAGYWSVVSASRVTPMQSRCCN